MICLDTNYLILGVLEGSPEADQIVDWYSRGEVIPFSIIESREAARLFNAAGRRRTLRFDSMIAATAIAARARLATNNLSDFNVFIPFGLELV